MLRLPGFGPARVAAIAAAALIAFAVTPDTAEAKRGFSFGGAHGGGSSKPASGSSHGDSGNAPHKPADEATSASSPRSDNADAEAAARASGEADPSFGAGTPTVVRVRTGTTEQKEEPTAAEAPAAAATPAAVKPEPQAAKTATPQPGSDYYGKRAKSILKGEDGAINHAQHPLAAAHPGMDVVVCEGGCNEVPAEIIYMQPTTYKPKSAEQIAAEQAAKTSGVKGAKVTAPSAPGIPASNDIVCLGGCYDTPRTYAAAAPRGAQPVALGEWMTSVTPTSATPAKTGSGDWMRKIDATRSAEPAAPAPAAAAPAPTPVAPGQ
jgi:hypothetical protein